MHYSRHTLTLITFLLASQVQAQIDDTNLTLTFSSADAFIRGLKSLSFSVREDSEPLYQHCFNLADVFGNANSTRHKEYTTNNSDQYDPQANYTTFTYKQLNTTGLGIGKNAVRLVKVWPWEDCREDEHYHWYGFSCQDNVTEFGIRGGAKSFSIVDRAKSNEDEGHCWTWAIDGRRSAASTSFKGCFVAMMVAVLSAVILVL
ncbi:unnamed protein product [Aureobasidium mustum]|uniref:Uncharacterized protein n=1 Tax=Aureobasidium mustum TaxID=2773714 RepID=A0A9N8PIW0_9PEZI|nr:unnamed protein product [Aureobasidium mustum]